MEEGVVRWVPQRRLGTNGLEIRSSVASVLFEGEQVLRMTTFEGDVKWQSRVYIFKGS